MSHFHSEKTIQKAMGHRYMKIAYVSFGSACRRWIWMCIALSGLRLWHFGEYMGKRLRRINEMNSGRGFERKSSETRLNLLDQVRTAGTTKSNCSRGRMRGCYGCLLWDSAIGCQPIVCEEWNIIVIESRKSLYDNKRLLLKVNEKIYGYAHTHIYEESGW